jgi:hypothetical protein
MAKYEKYLFVGPSAFSAEVMAFEATHCIRVKQIFQSCTQKRRILRRFQKYKVTLVIKLKYKKTFVSVKILKKHQIGISV